MKKNLIKFISLFMCLAFFCTACTSTDVKTGDGSDTVIPNESVSDTGSDSTSDVTDNKTQTSDTIETLPPEDEGDGIISVIAAGDNLAHEAVFTYAKTLAADKNGYDKKYYFDSMYDDVRDVVKSFDLALINQESQIRTNETASGYPRFASPVELGEAVMNAGFNVIVTANNHMLDKNDDGIVDTVNYWKDKPVIQIGSDLSENDGMNIAVFEQDGFKIALLAYTDVVNGAPSSVNKSEYAKYTYYNEKTAKKQIEAAKEIADFVIVSMHWGDEDEFDADSSQKGIARKLAELGANAIIGHHPHVVQTIEWIETENGKTLCVYSLGNFLSTMLYARNMVGMMVSFDIVTNEGEPYIKNVKVIPTVTHYSPAPSSKGLEHRGDIAVYLMENYTEKMAKSHGCNENESKTVTLEKLKSYITDNVPTEYLPDFLK